MQTYVYRLKNTSNEYTLGIFSSVENVKAAMKKLEKRLKPFEMIIIKDTLDEIIEENIEAL